MEKEINYYNNVHKIWKSKFICLMSYKYLYFKYVFKFIEFFIRFITMLLYFRKSHGEIFEKLTNDEWKRQQKWLEKLYAQNLKKENLKARLLVIIPFKDKLHLTRACVESLLNQDIEPHVQLLVVLVNNNSEKPETLEWINNFSSNYKEKIPTNIEIRFYTYSNPFNFAKLNNDIVKEFEHSNPTHVLCLNNDIEFIHPCTIMQTLYACELDPTIGVVGLTLLYSNQTIQHLFIAPCIKLGGAHIGRKDLPTQWKTWFSQPAHVVPAVTGAYFLVKYTTWTNLKGFCEDFPYDLQDLDFCLRAQVLGQKILSVSESLAYHHETQTRKNTFHFKYFEEFYARWHNYLCTPFYQIGNFSGWSSYPCRKLGEGLYPWWLPVPKDKSTIQTFWKQHLKKS